MAPEPRVRQTYKFHPNSVRRGQKPPFQLLTFFYRACVGLAPLQPSKPLLCALQPEPKKNRRFFCLQTIPGAPLRAPRSAKFDYKISKSGQFLNQYFCNMATHAASHGPQCARCSAISVYQYISISVYISVYQYISISVYRTAPSTCGGCIPFF